MIYKTDKARFNAITKLVKEHVQCLRSQEINPTGFTAWKEKDDSKAYRDVTHFIFGLGE